VQAGFLPRQLPDIPGWQLAATLQPSSQTSGDFYDVIQLPNDKLGILIADVTGKGMEAGLFMVLSRTLIRTFAAQYHARPDSVLNAANERILADIDTNQSVSVFYGILDVARGTLTYCNSGHSPPYLCRRQDTSNPNGRPVVEALSRTGMPLGIVQDATWERRAVRIDPGDTLILYTDGLTDAQDPRGRPFGERRLLATVRAQSDCSAQGIEKALMSQVHEFVGDAPQLDDIALAIVAREAGEQGDQR
jgi:serine phosphatase RsbU (regulator of sigma subunit)